MKQQLKNLLLPSSRRADGDLYGALDIGSSKIVCFIARASGHETPRIVGIGHQLAEGMKQGAVSNMEALQYAISQAVGAAEDMAGETLQQVTINIAGVHLTSHRAELELSLNSHEVTENDLARIQAQGPAMLPDDPHGGPATELLHNLPVSYALDDQKGIRDPLGMTGNLLRGQMHLVSARFGALRTLETVIARCHLDIAGRVAAPYASGLACLVEDEMELGSVVIDMGAGTTSFALFFDGHMIYAGGVPLGGAHVTSDIARGLTTSVTQAERLKTLYGHATPSPMDSRDMIEVPLVGEEESEDPNTVPKAHLIRIIQPRIEETLELVRAKIEQSGFAAQAGRRVVLTGGASQLSGVRELAQRVLDKQVRLGRPLRVARHDTQGGGGGGGGGGGRSVGAAFTGLAESTSGPAFATTAGLLAVAMQPEWAGFMAPTSGFSTRLRGGGTVINRLKRWIRQNV